MTEQNTDTNTDANADAAKGVAEALAAQNAKFDELIKSAGSSPAAVAMLTEAKGVLDAAEKAAADVFKARDEAKKGAQTADQQIAEMRAQLRSSEVKVAAAEAGASNAALLVNLIGPDDDISKRLTELKESDPYLFGTAPRTGGGSTGGLDLGQSNGGQRPDPVGDDAGLAAFGDAMNDMVGIKTK